MIIEYIRYQIAAHEQHAFEAAYRQAELGLLSSPHCLGYELSRCVEESASYILRIEWDSAEGHLQGFRQSGDFRTFFQSIRPYVNDITEMRHYEVTDITGRKV